jgi:hypothetical protein
VSDQLALFDAAMHGRQRVFGVNKMRSYSWLLLTLACCCAFALGGYAVGAYMQFVHTITATQDIFARDVITAQGLVTNQQSKLLEWLRTDAPLQYRYLTEFERIRNEPLPIRLSTVTRITWSQWSLTTNGLRSSERLRQMMDACKCGLAGPDAKP